MYAPETNVASISSAALISLRVALWAFLLNGVETVLPAFMPATWVIHQFAVSMAAVSFSAGVSE